MESNTAAVKESAYTFSEQPKARKRRLSFAAALFISFSMFIFAPADLYLSNIESVPVRTLPLILLGCAVYAVPVFAALYALFRLTKGKLHIICTGTAFGMGLALYLQGNFIQMETHIIDGSKITYELYQIIINTAVFTAAAALPLLLYFMRDGLFEKVIVKGSFFIFLVQLSTLAVLIISAAFTEDGSACLKNDLRVGCSSTYDMNTYSTDRNFIVIMTDEYDSFCYDSAAETEPECISGFAGFTYYRDALGMYDRTLLSVPNIFFGQDMRSYSDKEDPGDELFRTLRENGYKIDIYRSYRVIPENILIEYADNYRLEKPSAMTFVNIGRSMNALVAYKYSPLIIQRFFWLNPMTIDMMISDSTDVPAFSPDDLDFYNSFGDKAELIEKPCFKFFYLNGLHSPRDISADLTRDKSRDISGDEQAIAMNKILSAYFDMLRENGVYDNSEIVVIADHGIKNHEGGKYPLLAIKLRNSSEYRVSDAPVSFADAFPTLLAMARDEGEDAPIVNVPEDAQVTRVFDYDGFTVTGKLKP